MDEAARVIQSLPAGAQATKGNEAALQRDGQVRLWWDGTPLDLFLNTTDFHEEVSTRIRWEQFAERSIPFLSCNDLAVFKAFFNRIKSRIGTKHRKPRCPGMRWNNKTIGGCIHCDFYDVFNMHSENRTAITCEISSS